MKNKKYYTISEVVKILNVPANQLRYLEKVLSTLKVIQLKGRRYYTNENISVIKTKLSRPEIKQSISIIEPIKLSASNDRLILQIDQLIIKFDNLLSRTIGFAN